MVRLHSMLLVAAISAAAGLAAGVLMASRADEGSRATRPIPDVLPVGKSPEAAELAGARGRILELESRIAGLESAAREGVVAGKETRAPAEAKPERPPVEALLPQYMESKVEMVASTLRLDERQEAAFREAFAVLRKRAQDCEAGCARVVTEDGAMRIEIPDCAQEWASLEVEWKARLAGIATPAQLERWSPSMNVGLFDGFGTHERIITLRTEGRVVHVNRALVNDRTGSRGESNATYTDWESATAPYRHLVR